MRMATLCLFSMGLAMTTMTSGMESSRRMSLPPIESKGELSIEEALERRRSVRDFGRDRLDLADVSQLLWSAQGLTGRRGFRTAPSAGALYPLELYVVAGNVEGLSAGVYHYRPKKHELVSLANGDLRRPLALAALDQRWVSRAPAVLVIAAVYERTAKKYGQRARRYVHMEVGFAAQNIYLQATARSLGTVMVGAFDDNAVQDVLGLPSDHEPLGLMPVGRKQ